MPSNPQRHSAIRGEFQLSSRIVGFVDAVKTWLVPTKNAMLGNANANAHSRQRWHRPYSIRSPIVDLKPKWASFTLVVHASSRAHPFL
jgi:hypothetical protein